MKISIVVFALLAAGISLLNAVALARRNKILLAQQWAVGAAFETIVAILVTTS